MAFFFDTKATSGFPGTFLLWILYPFIPLLDSSFRINNSGPVFFDLFALITRETVVFLGMGALPSRINFMTEFYLI